MTIQVGASNNFICSHVLSFSAEKICRSKPFLNQLCVKCRSVPKVSKRRKEMKRMVFSVIGNYTKEMGIDIFF
jgi:hypothetical protein